MISVTVSCRTSTSPSTCSAASSSYVTQEGGDDLVTRRIEIDPDRMTVRGLLDEIASVPGLNARLGLGRIDIDASGHEFHFGRPIDTNPDADGTFGGGRASHVNGFGGPFSMSGTTSLDMVGPSGAFSVIHRPLDLRGRGEDGEEIAAILNADANFSANNLRARVVGDRLAIQTKGEGVAESFQITGGSAATPLGLKTGTYLGRTSRSTWP